MQEYLPTYRGLEGSITPGRIDESVLCFDDPAWVNRVSFLGGCDDCTVDGTARFEDVD